MPEEIKKTDFVQSIEKGLNILGAFDLDNDHMTITQVATRVGLNRANARRILLTLQHLGYLSCTDGKRFALTPKVLSLGYAYLSGLPFRELAMPFMQELTHQLNESCSMSVLDGPDIVYVARVHTRRIMTIGLAVGTRLPAHATSMGKVLLAGMPHEQAQEVINTMPFEVFTENTLSKQQFTSQLATVARQGWAIANEEVEIGVRSIATPIHNKAGKVVAALNISGHSSRVSVSDMQNNYLPVLKGFAQKIETALKHTQ